MEFEFNCEQALRADANGFTMLDGNMPQVYMQQTPGTSMNAHRTSSFMNRGKVDQNSSSDEKLIELIDKMGEASAKAQKLPQIITTCSRLFTSDNKIFMRSHENKVIGFIKTGKRNLFVHTAGGMKEIKPLCVLDFYVHESMQRGGHGRALFDLML